MGRKGVVAAGHGLTAQAAEGVLREGGNAFDAVVAAHYAACVAEPVLASLGGGGFLLAAPQGEAPRVYDFFTHTPRRPRPPGELDFHPILADFGTARQEFHIGLGAIATPGAVKGVFAVHRDLCTMPMRELAAPAARLAREGVRLDALQAYIFSVVAPIYTATPAAAALFARPDGGTLGEGERYVNPALADLLEVLAIEGEDLFYRGEVAAAIVEQCASGGGQLGREDLARYEVIRRRPLERRYHGARLQLNPPPSSGGILIAFALALLESDGSARGPAEALLRLARIMALTQRARLEAQAAGVEAELERLLDPALLARYRAQVAGQAPANRGTTHISVMDGRGNVASLTVSNGEGCGHVVPGTGLMLNNMLGEADLNPGGFHRWPADRRMSSMMAPALVEWPDGRRVALGSGGSNRIRTAILQVLVNLVDRGMDLEAAVRTPRIHLEGERLSVEGGHPPQAVEALRAAYPQLELWEGLNLFFGGVHAVEQGPRGSVGAGDPRRGGVSIVL